MSFVLLSHLCRRWRGSLRTNLTASSPVSHLIRSMSHGALSPQWGWRNIRLGLDEEQAARLQTTFFRSEALVECYRDVYYGAAGTPQWLPHVRLYTYGAFRVALRKSCSALACHQRR